MERVCRLARHAVVTLLYQVAMLDVTRDEPRVVDVPAYSEESAVTVARKQYPATTFDILLVTPIRNPDAVSRWPLRKRKAVQQEMML